MNKWPQKLPELTPEQQEISRDFMNAHLHALQNEWYSFVEIFNHKYPLYSLKLLSIARNLSARPHFEKLYNQSYDWFIKSQHINMPEEILCELELYFSIIHSVWFPLLIPSVNLNLFIGLTLRPK
ncbi:MAG: hypothetical protein LBJ45_00675 [Holosporaceae bacterium]|jgi:hypothetical protein|nr:hypothetical protein [Holosporaceae bacterium]